MDDQYREHLTQSGEWSPGWGRRWRRQDFVVCALILVVGGITVGAIRGSWFDGVATMVGALLGGILVRLVRVRALRKM